MDKLAAVRRAYRRGGPAAVVQSGRRWLARLIYPGPLPVQTKPTLGTANSQAKQTTRKIAKAPVASVETVGYDEALAWFESRRAIYLRLAEAVRPYVEPHGVVLDVGANIGYFTKMLTESLGFEGRVELYEPLPRLAEFCRRTVATLPCQATVHEFGLSNEEATLDIYVAADGNLGWNTLITARATPDMTRQQIHVRPFEMESMNAVPCLVKIDVEGAEFRVLGGMISALENWTPRPAILCEIGWGKGHPHWSEELATFTQLAKLGYASFALDGTPLDVRALQRTTDVLFLTEDRWAGL